VRKRTPKGRKSKPRSTNGPRARHRWLGWLGHVHIPIGWTLIGVEVTWLLLSPPHFRPNPPDWMHNQISAPLLLVG
jgi:hypothetical protein